MGSLTTSKKSKAATTAAVVSALSDTIGDMVDQLHALREQKRELQAEMDKVEGEYKGVEEALMAKLEEQKTTRGSGTKANCSISISIVGNVTDWDSLYKYVKKTGHFHLFHRRLSDAAVRELFELKGDKAIPGVEPFAKKRLSVTSL